MKDYNDYHDRMEQERMANFDISQELIERTAGKIKATLLDSLTHRGHSILSVLINSCDDNAQDINCQLATLLSNHMRQPYRSTDGVPRELVKILDLLSAELDYQCHKIARGEM